MAGLTQISAIDTTRDMTLRNRPGLFDSANAAIAAAHPTHHVVLITIDTRNFNEINLEFGFEQGDAVLEAVALRLQEILRPEDRLFRTGDDEFSVLLNPVLHRDHALLAVNKIHSLFEQPVAAGTAEHDIDISIGLSVYPDTAADAQEMVKQSVLAMNLAKHSHEECVVYEPEQSPETRQRAVGSAEIKEALYSGQIKLLYQPIIEAQGNRIAGVEGLARWVRGKDDIVLPSEFIPVAEQSGLISRFTQWALNTALRECADFSDLFLNVNISAQDLEHIEFPDLVHRALSTWGVPAERLVLEVTETTLMRDLESTRSVLDRLSATGIKLAIDDFGSGYSSLKYIRDLPVSFLKIDGSFIENLDEQSEDKPIVDAVCKLGHSFGLEVIGEGVSSDTSRRLAVDLGCNYLQGYYLGRPLDLIQLQQAVGISAEDPSAPQYQ